MRRTLISMIILSFLAAASGAASDQAPEAIRIITARISEHVERYLEANIREKSKHLDAVDVALWEFERIDITGAWKATILNERAACLMRRAKIAVMTGDKSAARKAALDFQKAFEGSGKKLGPKWFENGGIKLQMLVEFADTVDATASDAVKSRTNR